MNRQEVCKRLIETATALTELATQIAAEPAAPPAYPKYTIQCGRCRVAMPWQPALVLENVQVCQLCFDYAAAEPAPLTAEARSESDKGLTTFGHGAEC